MILFRLTFPKAAVCGENGLYFKTSGDAEFIDEAQANGGISPRIVLKRSAVLSFDTHFNCFSYSKYLQYTVIKDCAAKLILSGGFKIRLIALRGELGAKRGPLPFSKEIIVEKEEYLIGKTETDLIYNFENEACPGFYYLELEAVSDNAVFFGGYYYAAGTTQGDGGVVLSATTQHPRPPVLFDVKIAIAICTFKREKYVYQNIANLAAFLHDPENADIRDKFFAFIIDNGHTLEPENVDYDFVQIFQNKNLGGSGGFTRGIMEAYARRGEFSHVLLMDDDIVFDAEILRKSLTFLLYRKAERAGISIGGIMIKLDDPAYQHEAGGMWDGTKTKVLREDLDLRKAKSLLLNEAPLKFDYNGWWYMCMPLSAVGAVGLPLPFFIKTDDIEYGLRLTEDIVVMNGISVWHESFKIKSPGHLEYYIKRNELAVAALHNKKPGICKQIKKLYAAVGRQFCLQKYSIVGLIFDAYRDFFKGVDFFLKTDGEELNKRLLGANPQFLDKGKIQEITGIGDDKLLSPPLKKKIPPFKRMLLGMTLDGYLIPKIFYKKGYVVVDALNCHPADFFRAKKVLHYNFNANRGFITKIKKTRLISTGFRIFFLSLKILFRYKKTASAYRKRVSEISNRDFWSNVLGLN